MTNTINSKSAEQSMIQQAIDLALSGKRVTFVSAEHTNEEICLRFMAIGAKVSIDEARSMLNGTPAARSAMRDAHLRLEADIKAAGGALRFGAQIGMLDWADLGKLAKDTDYMIVHMPAALAGENRPRGANSSVAYIDTLGFWPSPGTPIVTDAGMKAVAKAALPQYVETLDVLTRKWTPGTYLDITDENHLTLCVPDDDNQSMLGVSFNGGCHGFISYMLSHAWYKLVDAGEIEGGRWIVQVDDPEFRHAKLADVSDYT